MGIDTHGLLKGNVEPEKVLNFIKCKYDNNAKSDVKTQQHELIKELDFVKEKYGDSQYWEIKSGRIDFKYGEEQRSLFYCYDNINTHENLKFYSEFGLEEMVKSETTYLSLGYWGNSVEIMKSIVTEFGGWLDENDCDDKEYYPIVKNSDGTIKDVLYVTMQDIYEKFDNQVVIIKEK